LWRLLTRCSLSAGKSNSLLDGDIGNVLLVVCGSADTLLVRPSLKTLLKLLSVWVEGLRILVHELLLADSLVGVPHLVVDAASSDLGALSSVVG
jgi:hypothetical protein